ncbi:MAG: DUF86 domain-containing protein [Nitrospirae bacterium]|nr:DUF86 domain-containing protein [Nitrospirota bacterium]MBF0593104.1 DUF86 domain-containing protein [Nitrospirota bacterium]
MSKRQWRLFIEDIFESADKIVKYTDGLNSDDFFKDPKTYDAVMRNLQIMGEAVKNVPREIKERYKHIHWKNITGLRNIIVHEYFGVKESVIWDIIKNGIPDIKRQIENILKVLHAESDRLPITIDIQDSKDKRDD